MNIDFHYGVIYAVARIGGFAAKDAQTVAHACQYVDDATTPGVLEFSEGQTYERFASAHVMLDYRNEMNDQDKLVWAPFHFLPGGDGNSLDEKAVCRPDSVIAKTMVKRAIEARQADNALHRLGITLHTYVDTWAHQGFTGTVSKRNHITYLKGDDHDEKTWLSKLNGFLGTAENTVAAIALDTISGLGHGAALHFPDMPWATWEYIDGHGAHVYRQNLPDFVMAADMACKAIQGFINGNPDFSKEPGLSGATKSELSGILSQSRSHDEKERLSTFRKAFASGAITSCVEAIPGYIPKGVGSWKYQATGIADKDDGSKKPVWSETFESSDYRKFHDAIKEHRFVVTQEILPAFGIRLA
jgi:hypothetical protein